MINEKKMPDPLGPGSSIAHYRIVSRLGQGGMGQVFLAADTRLERNVALKVLPPDLAADRDRMNRFLREARIASTLTHPNIPARHEIGEAGGVQYLAMEYVEGEPLSIKIASGAVNAPDAIAIAAQVADALDAAHSRSIIHRDIKPANIMITPRGNVKLLDFGLAKLDSATPERDAETQLLTTAGALLGTVFYMSPEQALGRPLDGRTDLFSLGVVLYEMITGRLPFRGANSQETIAMILQNQPEAIARFNYETPEALERVVRKCLEKDRERRYASARDLLVDLRAVERDSASSQDPLPPAKSRLRAVIVDDEELARHLLKEYLASQPDIELAAECANGFEAVKAIGEQKPDLVFLDVQMPKLDGFEVLELIDQEIAVIFTTAYDTYAMRAFDANAVDYLLKPFGMERFETALERARQRLVAGHPPAIELSAAARPPQQYLQRLVVKDGAKVHIIPTAQLDYAEAQDDYVALHSQGKSYLKQQTISSLESAIDPAQFVRIHRSAIVNIDRINRIEPYTKDSRIAVLNDGTRLPISRAGYERLTALLGDR